MKVLVTGGAGYLGSELVYQLSKCSDVEKIIVHDNLSRGNFNLFTSNMNKVSGVPIQMVNADILDTRLLKKTVAKADVVYNLAAKTVPSFAQVDPHYLEQVNHWGTSDIVTAVEEASSVTKLIHLSTASVYGATGSKKLADESSDTNPASWYSISKLRGEEHARRLGKKKNVISIRCGNVYGYTPSIRFDGVINRFMFDAQYNNRISIYGNGKQARPFISVRKVVDCLVDLRNKDVPSDVYNLVDKNIEVLDLVDIMKEIYPPLEFIFINQHLEMRDLRVNPETKLSK